MRPIGIVACLALLGCSPQQPREDANPAPSSSLTRSDADYIGVNWMMSDPTGQRAFFSVASSGSMAPVLDSRSLLLVEPAALRDLRLNDIAVYERGGGLIVHRVCEIRSDGVLFSGDNNQGGDGWIQPDRIRGRVAGIVFTKRD